MSSLTRRIEKRILKKQDRWKGSEQPVRHRRDGGYSTLRPTKGWLIVSAKRLAAQFKLNQMREQIARRL